MKTNNLQNDIKKQIIITIFIICAIIFYYYSNESIHDIYDGLITSKNCSIFNENVVQPSVIIDGVSYPKLIPLYRNHSYNFKCMQKINKKPKVILLGNKFFGDPTFYMHNFRSVFKGCPVHNCELTNDLSRWNESSFVVYSMTDPIDHILPHALNQRWIFLMMESPARFHYHFEEYNNLFNLSSTYRSNSNFLSSYSTLNMFEWSENFSFDFNTLDYHSEKTELGVAVISNCNNYFSNRIEYLKQLKDFMPVHILGKCGTPCNKTLCDRTILQNKYKFYFAFENSLCEDYITEKFFDSILLDWVVVTLGAGPYDLHVPKSAYINALDYESPAHLAKYLLYLDSNKTAYNEYFKWRRYLKRVSTPAYGAWCEMCIRLNIDEKIGIKQSIIEDMDKFWNPANECKRLNNSFNLVPF